MSGNWQHKCAAEGCDKRVKVEFLMCLRHWSLVPAPLKQQVYAAFRDWQRGAETIEERKGQADALRAVQRLAVEAVADAERKVGA